MGLSPLKIGPLQFNQSLIQGPLAGVSCSAFRRLFSLFLPPAYCVSEMLSANDLCKKITPNHRLVHRASDENKLCYQISGNDPRMMREAAKRLEDLGGDLIDINVGCPKPKIRKKGCGSALLEQPDLLIQIIDSVKKAIQIPLTVKIRLHETSAHIPLAKRIEEAGADALIVHGRRWSDEYDIACDWGEIGRIKQAIRIPVIGNGDIKDELSYKNVQTVQCDGYMVSRAGVGRPWFYQALELDSNLKARGVSELFMAHIEGLAQLEGEVLAVMQSRKLVRYYFREARKTNLLKSYYQLKSLEQISKYLPRLCES